MGLILVAVGCSLAIVLTRKFRAAGTSVMPGEPAKALVTEGAYRVTRNPMYIGLVLVYFGLCIVLTSVWMLLLIPVLLILHRHAVLREEPIWSASSAMRINAIRSAYRAGSSGSG